MHYEDSLSAQVSDRQQNVVFQDIYVCTYGDCQRRFLTLPEVQKHKEDTHHQVSPPPALHTFYVLHAAIARHAVYKSTARFWCRLCSEEKAFWDLTMLADHARNEHPDVNVSDSVQQLASVAAASLNPSSANKPDAMRDSSHDTVIGDTGNQGSKAAQAGLEWNRHRAVLSDLYIQQDKSLDQVMTHMSDTYGFHAKMRLYKETFKMWGFDKNIPARDMGLIVNIVEKRKREHGKETQVFFKERPVHPKKLERFKRRKLQTEPIEKSSFQALPSYIRFETPTSDSVEAGPGVVERTPSSDTRAAPNSLKTLADVTLKDYWELDTTPVEPIGELSGHAISGSSIARGIEVRNGYAARQTGHRLIGLFTQASIRETLDDYQAAERFYRDALKLADFDNQFISVYEALRGIIRVRGRRDDLKSVVPELQRLVGGCLCLFGPSEEVYQTLALELAVQYYAAGRQLEGNALVLRLLALCETSSEDSINEDAIAWLLTRICRWNPEAVESPRYNAVYWRLIEQYEQAEKWPQAVTLTLDIVESLDDSDLEKTSESYLRRAYGLYVRHDKLGRHNYSYKLLDLTLAQLRKGDGAWMDRVQILFAVLRDDIINDYFTALPIVHDRQPITKLLRCSAVLQKPQEIGLACSDVYTKSILARHWTRQDWTAVIDELSNYSRELGTQAHVTNAIVKRELFQLAKFFATVRESIEATAR